jgi:hypothetical protein
MLRWREARNDFSLPSLLRTRGIFSTTNSTASYGAGRIGITGQVKANRFSGDNSKDTMKGLASSALLDGGDAARDFVPVWGKGIWVRSRIVMPDIAIQLAALRK